MSKGEKLTQAEAQSLIGILGDVDAAHFEPYSESKYAQAVRALNKLKRMAGWDGLSCNSTEWEI